MQRQGHGHHAHDGQGQHGVDDDHRVGQAEDVRRR